MQLSPKVWQDLGHANLEELAQQAPHLLPASGADSGGSGGAAEARSGTDATASGAAAAVDNGPSGQGSKQLSGKGSKSGGSSAVTQRSGKQQASVKGSSKSSDRQSSMHDEARCRRVVDAMQLIEQQRDAFVKVRMLCSAC